MNDLTKDISELTTLNPWSFKPSLPITLLLPLPAPPAKNITFLPGFGKPSGFGILALTPDLVVASVSSKSKTVIPLGLLVYLIDLAAFIPLLIFKSNFIDFADLGSILDFVILLCAPPIVFPSPDKLNIAPTSGWPKFNSL